MCNCPVYGTDQKGMLVICSQCSYDKSSDREKYPSLSIRLNTFSISAQKNRYQKSEWNCVYSVPEQELDQLISKIDDFEIQDHVLVKYHGAAMGVRVPEGIQRIGRGEFRENEKIVAVRLLQTINCIEEAFSSCIRLQEINFPQGLKSIGERAVGDCYQLIQAIYPSGLEQIRKSAFESCLSLHEVQIPGSVKKVEPNTFLYCSNLYEIKLEEGVNWISEKAFSMCHNLGEILLPASLREVGKSAFEYCEIQMKEGIEKIGECAFYGCIGLRKIRIPDSVKQIGNRAFSDCKALAYVKLDEGVEKIDGYAFAGCAVKQVQLPRSLKFIGTDAFPGYCVLKRAVTM